MGGIAVVGCVNLGNTCALNSILQSLASLDEFRRYLEEQQQLQQLRGGGGGSSTAGVIGHLLLQCLRGLSPSTGSAPLPSPPPLEAEPRALQRELMRKAGNAYNLQLGQQEDAQEIMQTILDQLVLDGERVLGEEASGHVRVSKAGVMGASLRQLLLPAPSAPAQQPPLPLLPPSTTTSSTTSTSTRRRVNPFQGWLANTLQCRACGWIKPIGISPFFFIHLPLPGNGRSCHIRDCLRLFAGPEAVRNIRCMRCGILEAMEAEELQLSNLRRLLRVAKMDTSAALGQQIRSSEVKVLELR